MVVGNLKALIIEPDDGFQSILKRKLKRDRSIVTFVKEAKECMKLDLDRFNVIFLGENTRKGSASDAYDYIRKLGFSGAIVIMTTDKHFNRDHYNGIASAINKPFDRDEFRAMIKNLGLTFEDYEDKINLMENAYVSTRS